VKSPAIVIAGLFFVLGLFQGWLGALQVERLSPQAQEYVRNFIERIAPTVLTLEKKSATANYRWGDKNRDCAGLVRYLIWEAMQQHDANFWRSYPGTRTLANNEFLSEFAHLQRAWTKNNFTAEELVRASRFIGRNIGALRLKTGDILFYRSPELKIRHVMLVVKNNAKIYFVYHTGDGRRELRIRTLTDLRALENSAWLPDAENPTFRGVYRPLLFTGAN